ncbi:MAG: hypothetical protein ACOX5G_01105 [Kiritimatiellia bacterium]
MINGVVVLFVMFCCASCSYLVPDGEKLNVFSSNESVIAAKSAVSDYMKSSHEPMSLELKDALMIFLHDSDSSNIAPWSCSRDGLILYHHGYTIGDEHTWFEIHLRAEDGHLTVKKIEELRETFAE